MEYKNIIHGIFKSRPNRFIAKVMVEDVLETVHVKNTGRCKELLVKERHLKKQNVQELGFCILDAKWTKIN